jgi:folate-binding protein YgfZ
MGEAHETVRVVPLAWSRIRARGTEAVSFLQGQLTQDVEDLGGQERWSLLLRPDSVVVTTALVRGADHGHGLDLVVPRAVADDAVRRLRRFLLRVDCTLEVVDAASGPLETSADLVASGWPGAAEFVRELTPHSFGAALVATTISFTKGCYTGQELVGRLDSRGARVPWRLVRASGPTLERVNAVLRSKGPDGPQGVTTAVPGGDGVRALGVAHRSLVDGETDGVLVETL